MSEGKHTAGKLRQCKGSHKDSCICGLIFAPDSERIFGSVHVERCPVQDHGVSAPPTEESKANARRVVAAWNACEGLSTEALEIGVVGELIAACKAMRNHGIGGEYPPEQVAAWDKAVELADAAIAKAEGSYRPLAIPDSRWDERWIYFDSDGDEAILHRVSKLTWPDEDETRGIGTSCCGLSEGVEKPGFLGRLDAPRCKECCRIVGIPEGFGAPYNHDIEEPK